MVSKIGKFFRLSRREQGILLEACCLMGAVRLAILLAPFKRLAPLLGKHMGESPQEATDADLATAKRIGGVIGVVSRYTPWESRCLVQAAAAQFMMKRRAITCTLYLGVGKDEEEGLIAHAWVRCGEMIVTGGQGIKEYTVVGRFADERKSKQGVGDYL